MKTTHPLELTQQLGADRVISPRGALPQPAERLDAGGPVRPYEFEVAVERLCLDSTSFRNVREFANGDTHEMADRILAIVARRGKMHNPDTDSGGVALGTVTAIGERFTDPPNLGDRVVTLASLTLTPLRLEAVTHIDPRSPQVEVRGTAYLCDRSAWGPLPDDIPLQTAVDIYDVYAAGTHTRDMTPASGTVTVLGCGHAGKLAMAAARDAGAKTVIGVDVDLDVVERAMRLGLCDIGVATDLRDPLKATEDLASAGAPPADLTVVVVNATRCEPTAILATKDDGTVLFFSMATNFTTAALTADGMSSNARMIVGSGYTPDVGSYALDLYRNNDAYREAVS